MGNNHNDFFGTNKRKVLFLGLAEAGKTTFINTLKGKETSKKNEVLK